jgi:hypothetical protein
VSGVDHPSHYNSHPSGVEAIDIVEHLPFNVGNALKYVFRREHKGREREDLEKAVWYLRRELERIRKSRDFDRWTPTDGYLKVVAAASARDPSPEIGEVISLLATSRFDESPEAASIRESLRILCRILEST